MADGKESGVTVPWLALEPPAALGHVLSGASVAVLLLDVDGLLLHANAAAVDLLGLDADRLLAACTTDVFGLAPLISELTLATSAQARARRVRKRVVRPDGTTTVVDGRLALAEPAADRGAAQAVAFFHELPEPAPRDASTVQRATAISEGTGRARDDRLVAAQLHVLRLVATSAPLTDALGAVVELLDDRLGDSRSHVLVERAGQSPLRVPAADLQEPADIPRGYTNRLLTPVPTDTADERATIFTDPAPGDSAPTAVALATAVELVKIALDRDHATQTLSRRAFHDELTGLANRNLLVDRLGQALNRARRRDRPLALMFVDLDRFKAVNDTFGHDVGDGVLQQFAERLRQTVRPEDTVARFGGDEFVVLIEQIAEERDVEIIAERLGQRLAEPFVVGDRQLHLTASVGLVVATGEDQDLAADLLRNADLAMYRAKQLGRNRREVFDDDLRSRQLERSRLAAELRHALAHDAFVLHYQPVVDLATGRVSMVEALLRWIHPERGELSPPAFLAAADDAGLLLELGDWVIRKALAELALWSDPTEPTSVRVAVNAIARQLARPDAVDTIVGFLRSTAIAPSRLALELPEDALVDGNPSVLESAARLRRLGVVVTVDDFGTGSTALSSLRRGDVDLVKLDHRFVAGLVAPGDARRDGVDGIAASDGKVARAVIAMAHALDLRVVAEGVETEGELAALRSLGCDLAQGRLFARPMPAVELGELLARTTRW